MPTKKQEGLQNHGPQNSLAPSSVLNKSIPGLPLGHNVWPLAFSRFAHWFWFTLKKNDVDKRALSWGWLVLYVVCKALHMGSPTALYLTWTLAWTAKVIRTFVHSYGTFKMSDVSWKAIWTEILEKAAIYGPIMPDRLEAVCFQCISHLIRDIFVDITKSIQQARFIIKPPYSEVKSSELQV